MVTSNEDFLKYIEEHGSKLNAGFIDVIDNDGNVLFEVDTIRIDYIDVSPDLDKIREVGYWGGQMRYNDYNPLDDVEYIGELTPEQIEELKAGVHDTIVLGGYCVVNRGELFFWKVSDMPEGIIEKYRFSEFEFRW